MDDIRAIIGLTTLIGIIWFSCWYFQVENLREDVPFDPEREIRTNRYFARFLTLGWSDQRVLWLPTIVQVIATIAFAGGLVAKYLFHIPGALLNAGFLGVGGNFMITAVIKFVVTLYLRNRSS